MVNFLSLQWACLSLGQAEDQIAVSSKDHGTLLHGVRERMGHVVNALLSCVLRLSLGVQQGHATIEVMDKELVQARRARMEVSV